MATTIGIGDLHLNSKKQFYKTAVYKFFEWLEATTFNHSKREETCVVLSGDIFNSVNICSSDAALFIKFINILSKKSCKTYSILGNHDYGIVGYNKDSIKLFLETCGIEVIDTLTLKVLENGHKGLFIPWCSNIQTVNEKLKSFQNEKLDFAVSHFEILKSFSENDYIDLSSIKSINQSNVFGGHIHNRSSSEFYCGSILPTSCDDDKSIFRSVIKIVDEKQGNYNIEIPQFIKFIEIDLDNYSNTSELMNDIQSYLSEYNEYILQFILVYSGIKSNYMSFIIQNIGKDYIYKYSKKEEVLNSIKSIEQDILFNKKKVISSYFSKKPDQRALYKYCLSKVKN